MILLSAAGNLYRSFVLFLGLLVTAQALSATPFGARIDLGLVALLLAVQNDSQHVEGKLGHFNAELLEIVAHVMPQRMTAGRPVGCDGSADGRVVCWSMGIHVAGVGQLATRRTVDTVNLVMR